MTDTVTDKKTCHSVTVAAGVFAPGHISELILYLPFELVDGVLDQTRIVERRAAGAALAGRAYFVLPLAMFPG